MLNGNHLNSVLIEGVMTTDPLVAPGDASCIFKISSKRCYVKPGGVRVRREESVFVVEVFDDLKLLKKCSEYGKRGRGVRAVGRLKESFGTCECGREHPTFAVIAESVEFMPEFKKSNSTKKRQQAKINKE